MRLLPCQLGHPTGVSEMSATVKLQRSINSLLFNFNLFTSSPHYFPKYHTIVQTFGVSDINQ